MGADRRAVAGVPMTLSAAQKSEIAKYSATYRHPKYRMSDVRRAAACAEIERTKCRDSYLDVGCGRGEMLFYARSIGFREVYGTEVVGDLLLQDGVVPAVAWDLPFQEHSVQVVTMFDVIEHLLPGDDERACREMARVASRTVLLTANNRPSFHEGVELHVNRRRYPHWDALFREWFAPARVTWLRHRRAKHSEMWRIDFE